MPSDIHQAAVYSLRFIKYRRRSHAIYSNSNSTSRMLQPLQSASDCLFVLKICVAKVIASLCELRIQLQGQSVKHR